MKIIEKIREKLLKLPIDNKKYLAEDDYRD